MTKVSTSDWCSLPSDKWNVRTVHAMFADLNREYFDVDYAPFRNWAVERGMIKNALAEHGPELLRAAVEECFRTYRPTREYPVLTAGFAIAYRINAVIPKLKAERARVQTDMLAPSIDDDELKAWL